MKRTEILTNRLKFVKGLQETHRQKALFELENLQNNHKRCCLGHGCNIFQLMRNIVDNEVCYGENSNCDTAPIELIKLLGLTSRTGIILNGNIKGYESLANLNDSSDMTTQEIGVILEPMINGGEGTPFISINKYEDE